VLFNSYTFVFVFLPLTLAGLFAIAAFSRDWALRWLICASLFFYAWWRPLNVLLIAPSIAVNYALARMLLRLGENPTGRRAATALLVVGIVFNVVFLGFFKYNDFIRTAINDVSGAHLALTHIILPLGISFITFQKIAFLVDVHAGRVKSFSFQDYCLFVLFFPQLVAGPIVHYREMMPQFQRISCRPDRQDFAAGLTLFLFGLFKKAVIADGISPLVTPIYEHAATVGGTSLLIAWMAAVGFTLQIYFDFSGYTDMALGIARSIGVRLPSNFDSPLRATSIIDFWLRWHMTLTRFLTAYIYNPLVLTLTRRRLAQGRPGFGGRNTTPGAFVQLLMFPTLLTMLISGLWHGAGYLFIVWGALHGCYLTVNHAWRVIRPKLWPDEASYLRIMKPGGLVLTFVSVVVAMVFFRSPNMRAAFDLLSGMIGRHGVALPQSLYEHLGSLAGALRHLGVVAENWSAQDFLSLTVWIFCLMVIVLASPNTLQILAFYEPSLGAARRASDREARGAMIEWRPSLVWALGISVIGVIGILSLGGRSEFLYWQF
jgi:D-alanyl-lipoteichoic acid acyltransferase DltB (MBOAT superfamily)